MAEPNETYYEERIYGLSLVNALGLPEVHLSKACVVKGHQVFKVETEKSNFTFRVTPSGLLRIDNPVQRR